MSQPIYGTVEGDTLTVPSGVPNGATLLAIISYRSNDAGFTRATWPSGMSEVEAAEFHAIDGTGASEFAERSYDGFIHDGRSQYTWDMVDGNGTISYAFIPNPNTTDFPSDGVDAALGALPVSDNPADRSDPLEDGTTIAWVLADGFAAPTSPLVWRVRVYAYADDNYSRIRTGVLVDDAKPHLTGPVGFGFYALADSFLPNPWTGAPPISQLLSWVSDGWIIHAFGGIPPLRQNQRDDIRQGQRTSRQLTVRQVGYL